MLKKVKDYIFSKIISNMNIEKVEPFLRKTYLKKSDEECYTDFSAFLNSRESDIGIKKLHEDIWFNILSKKYKLQALKDKETYLNEDNLIRLFKKEKDNEIKEYIFINYIESKKESLKTYVSGNHSFRGKVSFGFELEDLEGAFSGKIIQQHIHENGIVYFRFLEDVKVKNKHYRLSERDESKFYRLFRDISFENKSLREERAVYLASLYLCDFEMNDDNEDFLNLIECYVVYNNPGEYRRMKDTFMHSEKLLCIYENMLLKEKLLKEVPKEDNTSEKSVRRKRL